MIRIALIIALAAACGDKKDDTPQPVAASGSAPAGSGSAPAGSGSGSAVAAGSGSGSAAGSGSGSAAPPVAAQADVPTEVDFEDDATARITEKNIDVELKAIEKQLTQ